MFAPGTPLSKLLNLQSADASINPPASVMAQSGQSGQEPATPPRTAMSSKLASIYDAGEKLYNSFSTPTAHPAPPSFSLSTVPTSMYMTPQTPMTPGPLAVGRNAAQLPSYEALVTALHGAWEDQQKTNKLNLRLNCLNLFVNWANVLRTNKLRNDVEVGRGMITRLEGQVSDQSETIDSLHHTVVDLDVSLTAQKIRMRQVEESHEQDMDSLRALFLRQQEAICKLEQAKFNEDLVLDATLTASALWIVNLPIISVPVNAACTLLIRDERVRQWLSQSIRLLLAIIGIRFVRNFAMAYGLHSQVGNMSGYARFLGHIICNSKIWSSIWNRLISLLKLDSILPKFMVKSSSSSLPALDL